MCVYEEVSKRRINHLKTISLKGGFSDAQHIEKLKRLVNLSPPLYPPPYFFPTFPHPCIPVAAMGHRERVILVAISPCNRCHLMMMSFRFVSIGVNKLSFQRRPP